MRCCGYLRGVVLILLLSYISGIKAEALNGSTNVFTWPDTYQLSWQIDIPYIKELQKGGLMYQYKGWQDTLLGRQKTTRDGVESVIEFVENNTQYQIYPRIDTWGCRNLEIAGGKGPTRRLLDANKPQLTMMLPDLNEGRWKYNDTEEIKEGPHKGTSGLVFAYNVKHDEGYGEVVATYKFYVTEKAQPLRLYMWGKNLYTEGHFDAYIVDFYDYQPGPIPAEIWSVPDICPKEHQPDDRADKHAHWLAKLRSVLPSTHYGDDIYDAFIHEFGRRHASQSEYSARRHQFQDNKRMMDEHNKGPSSHKLGVNLFADWSHEEFLEVMLPNRGQLRPSLVPEGEVHEVFQRRLKDEQLPKTVDWRGSGIDSPVKDQAMCGSCWAFGTIGSMEAAYFRSTGTQKLLSEQELMDCAWDKKDENKGCMGGFQALAFQWLFPSGKLAGEAEYPYKGVTDFCHRNETSGIRFKNGRYVEVKGGEKALMEAIYTKGPMTVSVDAAPHSFAYYESGVYTEPACQSKLDKLDHAVIVSGVTSNLEFTKLGEEGLSLSKALQGLWYGTTDEGQDYWLVKNTWSAYWGDKGYLKIARQPHDCGIATQPIYVEFDLEEPGQRSQA